jgi:hypothetical protein
MSRLRRDSNFVDASNRWSAPMLQPNEKPAKSARTPIWRHWVIHAANDRCGRATGRTRLRELHSYGTL